MNWWTKRCHESLGYEGVRIHRIVITRLELVIRA